MKKYLTFYLMLIGVLLLLPLLYWLSCQVFLKLSLKKGDLWIHPIRAVKMHCAEKVKSPKVLVISGSNSLFADSGALSKDLGMPVCNLASYAGVPLQFFWCDLEKFVGKGDVVLMPLEFEYYTTPQINDHGLYMLYEWADDYYNSLSDAEKIALLFHHSEEWYLRHISKLMVLRIRPRKLEKIPEVIAKWEKNHPGEAIKGKDGLGYMELNAHGDLLVEGMKDANMVFRVDNPYPDHISPYFAEHFAKLKERVEAAGAKLVLTWPSICPGNRSDPADFVAMLASNGIKIYGEPVLYANEEFYDTGYHLNAAGAARRVPYLAAAVRQALGDSRKGGASEAK